MIRKNRPWLFYDTTTSICATCQRRIEAKIIIKEPQVFLEKWCPVHGFERVLICDDAEYYRICREVYLKPPEMPARFNTQMAYGCPYDCGLCPDHMQHSCVSVLEITDNCNLSCPICYAESNPQPAQQHRSLDEVLAMLDAVVANEGEADIVQLSGGEPTLHPDLFAILDAAKARSIRHLMINTNGLILATDSAFVERLAEYTPGLEIYLQFDSLQNETLKRLRGISSLAEIHQRALTHLEALGISTTLVMTVVPGINADQVGEVIQHALTWRCIRGVTLQPLSNVGRVEVEGTWQPLTISGLRRTVAEQSAVFSKEDVLPVPCNPDTLAMAYALKLDGEVIPLTRHLDAETVLAGPRNTIVFERDPAVKELVFQLYSTGLSPESQASCLSDLLCCLPRVAAPALTYEQVFRVLIVQFMDRHNLDLRALKKSCIHFAQPDGQLIPFEAYNLFYRGRRAERTAQIQLDLSRCTSR